MTCPEQVIELVKRFDEHHETYTSGHYNEASLRNEFINPFFECLGWDVYNKLGDHERFKDVVLEESIEIEGGRKRPDYTFRIGQTAIFFVEAKKPSLNLKSDSESAFQLRRYAWSAKLSLSILTDFEEFAVYDCRIKPHKNDKASTARIMYFTHDEYLEKWDEIASIFSPKAIKKGSFDKYAQSRRKRGTAEVDAAFLKEIELWRDKLARNIALRNRKLSTRELNFAVQRTIDRIIFLRICEDRGIERQNRLQSLLNGDRVYKRLFEMFHRADERYNSGLFHFQKEKGRATPPDDLTPGLKIDDKVLKEIIKNLYYPDSPYEFSVLPADILGQVYEQFLGKVIRLTPGHQAKVEDKPEVKKAGGVYYTPTYIVSYIVENTVGKLLEKKNPKQASNLKILDPACGSGSFLIGAYQYLLDYHLKWYSKHDPKKHAKGRNPKLYQAQSGDWRLTTSERKRILLNNIYGVDIDPQAVEVTKLSLLLKVLEGENEQTLERQLKLLHERALPDLSSNIKCGNSLIGPDFYKGKQTSMFDDEERYRINPFDWKDEFPEIFSGKKGKNPGFDAVIGNPPYVRGRSLSQSKKQYLISLYQTFMPNSDIYVAFLERAFTVLTDGGLMSFIIPRSYLTEAYASQSRRQFLCNSQIIEVVDFRGVKVFDTATVTNTILIIENRQVPGHLMRIKDWKTGAINNLPQQQPLEMPDLSIRTDLTGPNLRIVTKTIDSSIMLGELCYVSYSVAAHSEVENKRKDAYIFDKRIDDKCVRFVEAREISRYVIDCRGRWLQYDPNIVRRPGLPELFAARKIMVRDVVGDRGLICAFDDTGLYADYSVVCLTLKSSLQNVTSRKLKWTRAEIQMTQPYSLFYLLGIINSSLLNFVFRKAIGGGLHVYSNNIRQLPIRTIDFSNRADKSRHNRMVELVELMLKLHKDLARAKTDHEKTLIQRQIDATDRQIDKLVYKLYGLTDKEIRIVEEAK